MGWNRFFRRRHWDRERVKELDSYVEIETREHIARGMTAEKRGARHVGSWEIQRSFARKSTA